MSETHKGLLAVLIANLSWGMFPLFWMLLNHVPPIEVFAHRTFWSLFTFAIFLALQGRLAQLWTLFADPAMRWRSAGVGRGSARGRVQRAAAAPASTRVW